MAVSYHPWLPFGDPWLFSAQLQHGRGREGLGGSVSVNNTSLSRPTESGKGRSQILWPECSILSSEHWGWVGQGDISMSRHCALGTMIPKNE